MAKVPKGLGGVASALAWVATIFPGAWVALMTALAATGATLWLASLKWLESPELHTIVFAFLAFLWTIIGFVTIADRRKSIETFPKKDFRYGLTFEGLVANFDARQLDAGLQFGINLRNYSPSPLRFEVESFVVKLDSRTVETDRSAPNFMSRGAARTFWNTPYKVSHIKEFFGARHDGTILFSVVYGDVDGTMSRRLRMSFRTVNQFPSAEQINNPEAVQTAAFGFNSIILSESDESISLRD